MNEGALMATETHGQLWPLSSCAICADHAMVTPLFIACSTPSEVHAAAACHG